MEDHATSALIWNYKTREELREALENEIRSFTVDKVTPEVQYRFQNSLQYTKLTSLHCMYTYHYVFMCGVILWWFQDLSGQVEISWNHVEFEVRYECLSEEIKIGECVWSWFILEI